MTDHLWFLDSRVRIRVAAADAPDRLSIVEHWQPAGSGAPLHVHHTEDEVFHVLAGRLRLRIGTQDQIAGPGDIVVAPKGVPHTYRVESPEGAHVFTTTRGGDFEALIRELGRTPTTDGLPPAFAPTPEAVAALAEACARHGIALVGPPLA